ncbi:hypothetical protein IMZ48_18930, partial [Candidatus Bathyarchaeota archaeon]|nr:hypothetical protein [Candidatus Bathyarchaeota archaeon]
RPPHAAPGEGQYRRPDIQATADGPRQVDFSPESTETADEQLLYYINGVQDPEKAPSVCSPNHNMDYLSPMTMHDFTFTEDVPLFSLMGGMGGMGMYPAN